MFDLKLIRENPEDFDRDMSRRGLEPQSGHIIDLDRRHRTAQTALQEMQNRRNAASKAIGQKMKAGELEAAEELKNEVAALKEKMAETEEEQRRLGEELDTLLATLPNRPAPDVPDGEDEAANVCVRSWGTPTSFDFTPRQHFELGEDLGLMDFDAAAKLAGSRFVVMRGQVARLHRALAQFMIDLQTWEHGYLEIAPPFLVRDQALYGTGQLPKFSDDLFRTGEGYWLIPTAEVPLTNLAAEEILEEDVLPQRFTALTPCFRAEAGASGKDTRGMLRQHQFEKCELVSIAHPDHSEEEHERMTACAEAVLQKLELPYRVMVLSTGDMGFAARKTYDIEVWLPGQNLYREISSCSNCSDFQARRMRARFRAKGEKATRFVHTLNGSGIAVGRALIAVMENHQRADGTIAVPQALRPYLGGMDMVGGDA
ncbi:serine--tRNA ligase [Ferruginivarius sediminum]|uniref:Serine--tRNA ligase n=1 Tax=Ferruginivarius sediminum TaxID=2661937 RepID=A0A369T7X9_9PROT|nr:serine--tRNA ligase [Ferruginivarius sediminum]RDD61423.1 serine--tRNA ligase [Ferruginivarius sediminum]